EALAEFKQARALHRAALDARPDDTAAVRKLAASHYMIAAVKLETAGAVDALADAQMSLSLSARDLAADPSNPERQSELALDHGFLGMILGRLDRLPEALAALDKGVGSQRQLIAAYPSFLLFQRYQARVLGYYAECLHRATRDADAAAVVEE